ncbi:transmembrane protein 182-like isoform X3 [Mastacembelus armatus]|uniref:transmembrane protein 182-like isoform X3 n=1 Tax=Mastacembelus armatus TaxID=205130 RepID=UPI000E4643B1|nr:transmembrane protein 182-like isoform X3 [Mastacembelus armatus]
MSPAERLRVLLFLALFFGAVGFLFTLLSCGTEYWLLAAESCSRSGGRGAAVKDVRIFHEGLFWRCSFTATSHENSMWDLWISKQPLSKVCQAAFLFPFPLNKPLQPWVEPHSLPTEPYEHQSAIGLCLLAVVVMYLMWIQVLDTLEQFALHQRVSSCPSFHLSIQHGPSFLLAPVAVFFSLLAGLLFILLGQGICGTQLDKIHKIPELSTPDDYL